MDALMAHALGTLGMDPETFLWSTWRELNAMVRGYEQRRRDQWERALLLYNVQVEPRHRLTYAKLFGGKPKGILPDAEAEAKLRGIFGEAFDG